MTFIWPSSDLNRVPTRGWTSTFFLLQDKKKSKITFLFRCAICKLESCFRPPFAFYKIDSRALNSLKKRNELTTAIKSRPCENSLADLWTFALLKVWPSAFFRAFKKFFLKQWKIFFSKSEINSFYYRKICMSSVNVLADRCFGGGGNAMRVRWLSSCWCLNNLFLNSLLHRILFLTSNLFPSNDAGLYQKKNAGNL